MSWFKRKWLEWFPVRYVHDDYWDDIHGPGVDYAEGEQCHVPTCWCHEDIKN